MATILPPLGATGLYRLKAPFDSALLEGVAYTCESVRSIQDITSDGIDVYAAYYQPYQLSQDDYNADVSNGARIVTLVASIGNKVNVPSTYIQGLPDINGVPYLGMMVALDLAVLPTNIDLTQLKQRLESTVMEVLGVATTMNTVVTTYPFLKTQNEHIIIEGTRQMNITETQTDYAKYVAARDLAASLQQKVTLLEQYIETHLAPAP
jgi:hypothetical protein